MRDVRSLVSLVVMALVILAARGSGAAEPPAWWVEQDGSTAGVPWQAVTYRVDGLRVKGFLFDAAIPGRRPVVVFNHGGVSGVSADMMRRSADLARGGYLVFTPTYRGEGGSEGRIEVAAGEVNDVLAAVHFLREHPRADGARVALVGSSHGALISVLAAARDSKVTAVAAACGVMDVHAWYRYLVDNGFDVSDSLSVAVYGTGPESRPEAFRDRSAIRVAGKIHQPLLLMQGMKDRTVPPDQVWRMSAAMERAGSGRPEVRTYPLLGHAFWFWDRAHHSEAEVVQAEESWSELMSFLERNLMPDSHTTGAAPRAGAATGGGATTDDQAWRSELAEWQTRRAARLTADDGWLTVAGLFWLEPGLNRMGTAEDNAIRLPEGSAPPRAGSFLLENGVVSVESLPGVPLMNQGKPIERMTLRADADGSPDTLALGDLRMIVIRRSKGLAIRLRDLSAEARRNFAGIECFPPDPAWRIEARWVPYDPPKPVEIPNIIGSIDTMMAPGRAEFEKDGRAYSLEPVLEEGDTDLFYIFKDGTSGKTTYPPGRFLYSGAPVDGKVTLDFNRAYNPPCAFTAWATCPLPPRQNELSLDVTAGEKLYGEASGH
ncbi:MAG TPA: alpha/beta fold hydrolase [Candidatus Eisenbacteria bacterium]